MAQRHAPFDAPQGALAIWKRAVTIDRYTGQLLRRVAHFAAGDTLTHRARITRTVRARIVEQARAAATYSIERSPTHAHFNVIDVRGHARSSDSLSTLLVERKRP